MYLSESTVVPYMLHSEDTTGDRSWLDAALFSLCPESLFSDPDLLVVLHSWKKNHLQHICHDCINNRTYRYLHTKSVELLESSCFSTPFCGRFWLPVSVLVALFAFTSVTTGAGVAAIWLDCGALIRRWEALLTCWTFAFGVGGWIAAVGTGVLIGCGVALTTGSCSVWRSSAFWEINPALRCARCLSWSLPLWCLALPCSGECFFTGCSLSVWLVCAWTASSCEGPKEWCLRFVSPTTIAHWQL